MSDRIDDSPSQTVETGRNSRRKQMLWRLATVFVLLAAGFGAYWWFIGRFADTTDDAYVGGNVVGVSPQVAGTVVAIDADTTDLVRRGQPLVELDDTDTRIALDRAEAVLAQTVRQVRQMFDNVRRLRATVSLREVELARSKEDLARRETLIASHAVSREDFEHARIAYEGAQAALRVAQHELQSALALVKGSTVEHHPLVEEAKARLREAYVAWARHLVPAPVTGYVAKRSAQLGERVAPGMLLMAVVPLNEIWVDANFKEDQLSDIRLGQPATMTSDLYGSSVVYHGKVLGIGAGTGSSFELLPPQNASGNWIKIVQRVPVRVSLDPQELVKHPLRIGLSMKVSIDIHNRSGETLARRPTGKVVYSTPVYTGSTAGAERLILRIIRANDPGAGHIADGLRR
ncbi:MAG: HlyD family secretion protein [Acidiferrobacterales bacterium]